MIYISWLILTNFFRGKIYDGEVLLEVNDESVAGLTMNDLNHLIEKSKDPVRFKTVKEGYCKYLPMRI